MGQGLDAVEITFDQPIIISQRQDEHQISINHLLHPKEARKENFPEGAFAYTQLYPMIFNFKRPYKLMGLYLKMHRDSQFWNKETEQFFTIKGYLKGEEVLTFNVHANNRMWSKFDLHVHVFLDKLVVPAGMDVDNVEL